MSYCSKCEAYIPDGQTKCLACGFDEAAQEEKKNTGSGAYAFQHQTEELKSKLEEQRRRQQEESKRWAEEMRARRQAEAEKEKQKESTFEQDFAATKKRVASNNKVLAALSYLSILFVLPFIFCPEDNFAKFHAKQGLVLFVFGLIADLIGSLLPIGWLITLFRFYCIYKGMTNANEGIIEELPYIGRFAP